jgi:hypothetical protein
MNGLPSRAFAERCREYAAHEDVDNIAAVLLLVAAKEIEMLTDRVVLAASLLERFEMIYDA